MASILAERVLARMTGTSAADFARAEALVKEVLAIYPRNPLAHYAFGQVLRASRRNDQCIEEYQEALAFNPGWADALAGLGWCKFWVGSFDKAIELQTQAIRLSPRDPQIGYGIIASEWCTCCSPHRGGNPLARKRASDDPHLSAGLLFARRCLRPQRRNRARCR